MPSPDGTPFPPMSEITVTNEGVVKLLLKLNPNKTTHRKGIDMGRRSFLDIHNSFLDIWDLHTQRSINRLEMVQRRAERFVTGDYRRTSSVTSILVDLQWEYAPLKEDVVHAV